MKLGTLLANISETEGNTREQLKAEFLSRIEGHNEEKLLMECYAAACAGRKYISFNKNCLPPVEFEAEGFTLFPTYSDGSGGYEYYFG